MQVLFSEAAAREKLSNISEIISEELEESLETANLSWWFSVRAKTKKSQVSSPNAQCPSKLWLTNNNLSQTNLTYSINSMFHVALLGMCMCIIYI